LRIAIVNSKDEVVLEWLSPAKAREDLGWAIAERAFPHGKFSQSKRNRVKLAVDAVLDEFLAETVSVTK